MRWGFGETIERGAPDALFARQKWKTGVFWREMGESFLFFWIGGLRA